MLDSSRQDFNENIAKLKEEMPPSAEALEEKLKELEANSATRAEAQIIKFKESSPAASRKNSNGWKDFSRPCAKPPNPSSTR